MKFSLPESVAARHRVIAAPARPDRQAKASEHRPAQLGNRAAASAVAALADNGTAIPPGLARSLAGQFGPGVVARARLHAGPAARRSAADMDARAYTVGSHIVLGAAAAPLDSAASQRTLRHELAHVAQHGDSRRDRPAPETLRIADDHGDAERAARRAADGYPVAHSAMLSHDLIACDRDRPVDETRQARERRDRRRDPTSDLESDWAGEVILGHYLYGGGRDVDLYDDPAWSRYMMHSQLLRDQLQPKVRQLAAGLLKNSEGKAFPVYVQFHADVENGEGVVGYQYLHGTNRTVHDFQVVGWAHVERVYGRTEADGREVQPGVRIRMDLRYVWNDIIDPNGSYTTDRIKSVIATVLTGGGADSYRISISWGASCTVWFPEHAPAEITGYPADGAMAP